jgi:CheY-like chemotaxis protein
MAASGFILFIDDEIEWREAIVQLLMAAGYAAAAVVELKEAEEKLREQRFDLLLVDRLFGTDYSRGLEIIRTLKQRHPDQELILLTSHIDLDAVRNVFHNDVHTVLEKGNSAELLSAVSLVFLKKKLRLSLLRKPFANAFLVAPSLTSLRTELNNVEDARACFLDVIVLAGALAAVGPVSSSVFRAIVKDTWLAVQLPHVDALGEDALKTLAELAPEVVATLDSQERRTAFRSEFSIFVERAVGIREYLVGSLLKQASSSPPSESDRVNVFRGLLGAAQGVIPFGPEAVVSCLLDANDVKAYKPLNTSILVKLSAGNLLDPIADVVQQIRESSNLDNSKTLFEGVERLAGANRYYINVCASEPRLRDHVDWLKTYSQDVVPLVSRIYELEPLLATVPTLAKTSEICKVLLRRLNARFVDYVCDTLKGYPAWVSGGRGERPMMTPDILGEVVVPTLGLFKTVYLVVFDGMSLLSWARSRDRYLRPIFQVISDDPVLAVVPTATRYARSAIFAGCFPRTFMSGRGPGGLNECKLLNEGLAALGSRHYVSEREFMKYEARPDPDESQAKKRELDGLIKSSAPLKAIIFDPHDKVTHVAQDHVEMFSELFYEVSIHHVMVRLSQIPDAAVVIAVDHGFCEIQELRTIRGIFVGDQIRDSDTHYDPQDPERRNQFGKRYVDLGTRQFNDRYQASWLRFVREPARWGLPDSNGYLFAAGGCGFDRDAGPAQMYAHGGISMEEMIVPVAVLASRGSR